MGRFGGARGRVWGGGETLRPFVGTLASIRQADVCVLAVARQVRAVRVPRDEEEAVLVRVYEREEATAPARVLRRLHVEPARAQELVELVHVLDREEEVYAAPPAHHRVRLLRQHQTEAARAQRHHRRARAAPGPGAPSTRTPPAAS